MFYMLYIFFQTLPTVHRTHVLMSDVELAQAVGGGFWKKNVKLVNQVKQVFLLPKAFP